MKLNLVFNSIPRVAALTLTASIAAFAIANDAMKINSAQPSANAQAMRSPSATRVSDAIVTAPKNPLPQAQPSVTMPSVTMKPPATTHKPSPFDAAQKATHVAPSLLGNAITGLGDTARGIVAGESLVIQGRGFGASSGRVEIAVQTSASSSQDLSFRVSQWSDTEIRGSVAASLGYGDGKASITIYPAGKSAAEHISSGHVGNNATRSPWRFKFTATRVDQTIPFKAIGDALNSSYPWPEPKLLTHGKGLLNGLAVARSIRAGPFSCSSNFPTDKYKIRLSNGFELVSVAARDLNANVRHPYYPPEACEVRSVYPSSQFLRTAVDGSFHISPSWDHIQRNYSKTNKHCDQSGYYVSVTKSPLGFEWDHDAGERCAANAEYVIESIVVRGPAGVNPFFGTSAVAGGTIK